MCILVLGLIWSYEELQTVSEIDSRLKNVNTSLKRTEAAPLQTWEYKPKSYPADANHLI